MTAVTTPAEAPERAAPPTLSQYTKTYIARVRGGDIGSLPAIAGLVVLSVYFAILRPSFLHVNNIAALFTQGAAVTVIAMGLIFVLLIGEIDLSAGYTAGISAAVMTLMLTQQSGYPLPHGLPWYVAVLGAVVTGAVIGLLVGIFVTKLAIPSFVVTLAAYLGFQGIALLLLKEGNSVAVSDPTVLKLENSNLSTAAGWALAVVSILIYGFLQVRKVRQRTARGLATEPLSVTAIRITALAVLLGGTVYLLNLNRANANAFAVIKGVPMVVPLIGGLLVLWTFVLNRTAYGRHLYAVGGNREAARRAGIDVNKVRISAFVICSTMAAIGGIILASRLNSTTAATGGSDVLLKSVGAAVIGGASLFGGRGRAMNAVLGGAVIAVIDNGMGLMHLSSGAKFVSTGSVLLLAATVDALSRRRTAATS
jgi:D-xylose transport system permease protein